MHTRKECVFLLLFLRKRRTQGFDRLAADSNPFVAIGDISPSRGITPMDHQKTLTQFRVKVFCLYTRGFELGASKFICVFAESEKTVQWTVLRYGGYRAPNPRWKRRTRGSQLPCNGDLSPMDNALRHFPDGFKTKRTLF